MSISHEFDYVRPATLDEALEALAGPGARASVLAGGTDLVACLMEGSREPELLVDLKGVPGLTDISRTGDVLSIGALVTFTDVLESTPLAEALPILPEMARVMGSVGIRNRATIVGNICSAVPSCDSGPVLMVLDADVEIAGPDGKRTVPVAEWFRGPRETDLRPGEIVTRVTMPVPRGRHGGCYLKLRRNRGEDLAQAGVAVMALADGTYRVALGAVAPTPVRARRIEALLAGREMDDEALEDARRILPEETSPICDIRAGLEYRAHMLRVMLGRALRTAASRREGTGPAYGTPLI